ncbi:unnamed protein product [Durusdinium trenchii]|uniref:Neurotransmitter-gated ion-channel ligand-binding domain-containing protein n=2 Tax=Durusdinium trenchii TaxID=1381693 RepID=A0ABP0JX07_9DINO
MARSPAVLALLLICRAQEWDHLFDESTQAVDRRMQALPDGFEINETLNGSIPLTVIPSWDVFLAFSDREKFIKGRMSIATIYGEEATTFVTNPENMVDVVNFGSGSGDISVLSSLRLWDPKTGKQATSVSKTYVGQFSQSLYSYDLSCYPFDVKTMHFEIALQKPCGIFYRLVLGCAGEGSIPTIGQDGVVECSWPINASYVNFDWDYFTCKLQNSATITCAMTGTRHWAALLKTYIWPSIIYGLMGFLAFTLGVKLAMPRVATTMLALLSLTNLRNQVIGLLPTTDSASWMEEYFLIAISFMLLNLLGHAASFHLDASGRHHTQKMMNKFNLWGVFSVFVLVVLVRLHTRNCPLIDPTISLTMTLLAAPVSLSIVLFLVWYHRQAFREATHKLTHSVASARGSFHDGNV